MNKPDLFLVGAPKCGTTSLHTYLDEHPEIFMCKSKEPHFFARDIFGDNRAYRVLTIDDYLACFAEATGSKRVGESSVGYLGSRSAPAEIKAFNPAARIIIMLRNPVDMMYALHSEHVYDVTEKLADFEAALQADEKWNPNLSGRQHRTDWLSYRETAKYSQQVRRYFDVFGREQVHVIIYDDFARNPATTYLHVLRFLEVNPDFLPEFKVINSSHRVKSLRLQRFLLRQPEVPMRLTPGPLRKFVGRRLLRFNTVHERRPPMDPELRKRLLKEFEPEIEELSVLLGRDLSHWCKTAEPRQAEESTLRVAGAGSPPA